MSTFDLKSFMINEGLTRVSQDRKKLLKENRFESPVKGQTVNMIDGQAPGKQHVSVTPLADPEPAWGEQKWEGLKQVCPVDYQGTVCLAALGPEGYWMVDPYTSYDSLEDYYDSMAKYNGLKPY